MTDSAVMLEWFSYAPDPSCDGDFDKTGDFDGSELTVLAGSPDILDMYKLVSVY